MENYIMLDGQKFELDAVYFPSKELAMKAIDEIIKPFMAKHLDFTL